MTVSLSWVSPDPLAQRRDQCASPDPKAELLGTSALESFQGYSLTGWRLRTRSLLKPEDRPPGECQSPRGQGERNLNLNRATRECLDTDLAPAGLSPTHCQRPWVLERAGSPGGKGSSHRFRGSEAPRAAVVAETKLGDAILAAAWGVARAGTLYPGIARSPRNTSAALASPRSPPLRPQGVKHSAWGPPTPETANGRGARESGGGAGAALPPSKAWNRVQQVSAKWVGEACSANERFVRVWDGWDTSHFSESLSLFGQEFLHLLFREHLFHACHSVWGHMGMSNSLYFQESPDGSGGEEDEKIGN